MGTHGGISRAKDNSFKLIFQEPELFAEFIRDFIDIDILKGISASDIEDVTERYLPLFQENRDSDTVKKINIPGGPPLFVIAILEHESKVNFRTPFKMLQYTVLFLDNYEKEAEQKKRGVSTTKEFRYPPVLPIVFYDGGGRWTAETNFFNRTEMNDVFSKYIPKFEYELVSLNTYSKEDIITFGDTLSLIMLIDKIGKASDFGNISGLTGYLEKIRLNIPENLTKLLSDVIRTLLTKVNVPAEEIDELSGSIHERSVPEMFEPLVKYDVQETRRTYLAKGKAEGLAQGKAVGLARGMAKGEARGVAKEKKATARQMKADGMEAALIAKYTGLSIAEIQKL